MSRIRWLRQCCALFVAYALAANALLAALTLVPSLAGAAFPGELCISTPDGNHVPPAHTGDSCCLAACCGTLTAAPPRTNAAIALPRHARALGPILAQYDNPLVWPNERPRLSRAPPV